VAVDPAGNSYVTGWTEGSLGCPNQGGTDVFLSKHDAAGDLLWTRQLGTPQWEQSNGLAVDGSGSTYVAGWTEGDLGGPNAGGLDAFLAKYDADGNLLWTRQLGVPGNDYSSGIALDSAGNCYIGGSTSGSLGGPSAGGTDVFVAKYDGDGTLLWTHQFGTSENESTNGVAADRAGNTFLIGTARAALGAGHAGGFDAFLSKHDADGTLLWTHQIGTSMDEIGYAGAVDRAGNSFLGGSTRGNLGGPNVGGTDAFVASITPEPATAWLLALGALGLLRRIRRRHM
jgi:hypothetical protein